MVAVGKMRHRVTIQNRTETRDDIGGVTLTYATVETVWAHVAELTSGERYQAEQNNMHTTHRVTMRSNSNVKGSSRLVVGSKTLEVVGVRAADNTSQFIEVTCEEVSE